MQRRSPVFLPVAVALVAACGAAPAPSPATLSGAAGGAPILYEVTPRDGGAPLEVVVAVPPGPGAPRSVFGRIELLRLNHAQATMDVVFANSPHAPGNEMIVRWTEERARAVSTYHGRFPIPAAVRRAITAPAPGRAAPKD